MKNQYFGDVNDYRKYGLLRGLSANGALKTVVCWTLTPDDSRTDGSRVGYLSQPEAWHRYDPVVFSHLQRTIRAGVRAVKAIEDQRVLPNCTFFDELLMDDAAKRDQYFERFRKFARGRDLVFFDPDNGLGVKSVGRGDRNSSKYLYDSEVAATYREDHSILVYQHFPRREREPFVRGLIERLGPSLGVTEAFSFTTSHVVFLLLPQSRHLPQLTRQAIEVARRWMGQIRVTRHLLGVGVEAERPVLPPGPYPMPGYSQSLVAPLPTGPIGLRSTKA